MATPPPLNPPHHGDPINLECSYVKKPSAVRQADSWNEVLAGDPVLGPASGYTVGVGARTQGRYPLIWVPLEDPDA